MVRSKTRNESYSSYIYKVLKNVRAEKGKVDEKYSDVGISSKAMNIMVAYVDDCFSRIAAEAGKLTRKNGRSTLGAREIQTAVRLCLPPDFAKFAVSEGTIAVKKIQGKLKSDPPPGTFMELPN